MTEGKDSKCRRKRKTWSSPQLCINNLIYNTVTMGVTVLVCSFTIQTQRADAEQWDGKCFHHAPSVCTLWFWYSSVTFGRKVGGTMAALWTTNVSKQLKRPRLGNRGEKINDKKDTKINKRSQDFFYLLTLCYFKCVFFHLFPECGWVDWMGHHQGGALCVSSLLLQRLNHRYN